MRLSLPNALLRVEGLALAAAAILVYVDGEWSLWPLPVFFLAPDLSMLAYAAGSRIGSIGYDAAHTTALPLALAAGGVLGGSGLALQIALIWAVHIGADRLIGYGLKYPTAFKDTHLQRV